MGVSHTVFVGVRIWFDSKNVWAAVVFAIWSAVAGVDITDLRNDLRNWEGAVIMCLWEERVSIYGRR